MSVVGWSCLCRVGILVILKLHCVWWAFQGPMAIFRANHPHATLQHMNSPWSSFLAPRSSTRTCSSYGSQQSPCFAETGLILVPLTSMHRFLTNQEEAKVQLVPRSILAILRSAGMCCWWLLIHYPFTGKISWAYSHPLHSPPLKKFCPIPHFEELSCFIDNSEWDPILLCNLSLKILFQTSRATLGLSISDLMNQSCSISA